MKRVRDHLAVAAALLCLAAKSVGAAESGRELLDQAKQLSATTRKWTDRTQQLRLTIVDRRGNERVRDLSIYMKKYPDDANRSIVFFQSPADIKGTGFLQWANAHTTDEQWLYLPELKRVRQIGAGSKRESFVGTDFSYDDLAIISQLTDWSEAEAKTKLLREEVVEGQPTSVIEFTPDAKDVGYSKILAWLTRDDLVLVKLEMYDKQGRVQKVLTLSDIRKVGAVPTPFHMEMNNVQDNSRTVVDFTEVKYDTGLDDDAFTQRALERGL